MSGVVRDEDGVADAFRGIMDGDLECSRCSSGGGGGALATWLGPGSWCMDMRFSLRVSVGLMVLAPSPLACDACGIPGMTDCRRDWDELPLFPLLPPRGDLGEIVERRLLSGVERFAVFVRGSAWCIELAFVALLLARFRGVSNPLPLPASIEARVKSVPPLALVIRLGLLLCAVRLPKSVSVTPEPVDFLGGFAMLVFDTGG